MLSKLYVQLIESLESEIRAEILRVKKKTKSGIPQGSVFDLDLYLLFTYEIDKERYLVEIIQES